MMRRSNKKFRASAPIRNTMHQHSSESSPLLPRGRSEGNSPAINMRIGSEEIAATRLLYNFLCLEGESPDPTTSNEDENLTLLIFEQLICDEIVILLPKCKLRVLLGQFGWNGDCFNGDVDLLLLRQELGNLYLADSTADAKESQEMTLKMFCPDVLLQALSDKSEASPDYSLSECVNEFFGTCMLADISGFTRLASSLCSIKKDAEGTLTILNDTALRDYLKHKRNNNGSSGLDELRSTTNSLLGNLVQIIYTHGGDVIAFAGDALLCVFTDSALTDSFQRADAGPTSAVRDHHSIRAYRCSQQLASTSISSNGTSLSLHTALSCGHMSLAVLGGHEGRWVYALMGGCLSELGGCINDARKQETVMTTSLYRLIQDHVFSQPGMQFSADLTQAGNMRVHSPVRRVRVSEGSPLRPPSPLLGKSPSSSESILKSPSFETRKMESYMKAMSRTSSPGTSSELSNVSPAAMRKVISKGVSDDLLKPFIPSPIAAALESGAAGSSELRHVTTMFLQLDSYTAEMCSAPLLLQPLILIAQRALSETGGFLRQFLVDDKGCVLIGMWGVPMFSHKNNTVLALKCSLVLQERLRAIDHRCSIGIATGLVYCSSIGSSLRKDYVGIGDKVNFAARLMSKAKGRILVDDLTQSTVPLDVKNNLSRAEEMLLKGIDIPNYRPFVYNASSVPEFQEENVSEILSLIRSDITQKISRQLDRLACYYVHTETSRALQRQLASISQKRRENDDEQAVSVSVDDWTDCGDGPKKRRSFCDILSGKLSESPLDALPSQPTKTNYVNFIIIEGLEGLSLSNVAENYRQQVVKRRRKISAYFVEGKEGDHITSYGVIRQLFKSIIMDKMKTPFRDEFEQRKVLKGLLLKKKPKLSAAALERALFDVSRALDLNWSEEIDVDDSNQDEKGFDESFGSMRSLRSSEPASFQVETTIPLLDVLRALLQDTCTSIVIENGHYCDELSWFFLEMLHTVEDVNIAFFITMYPLSLSLVARNSVLSDSSIKNVFPMSNTELSTVNPQSFESIVENKDWCDYVSLKSFRLEDVNVLLCRILQVAKVDTSLLNAVFEISLANPIWCVELALFIKHRGVEQFGLQIDKNRNENPLAALITYRFDSLDSVHQAVVKYASVIGDTFTFDILFAIIPVESGLSAEAVTSILNELVKQGFINMSASNVFGFQHELVRDTLYAHWPPSNVAVVHNSIATFIEVTETNLRPYYPRLCYHYFLSKTNRENAFKYTVKAADQYVGVCAYKEGLMYARSAFEMATTRTELRALLLVIEVALSDISPNIFHRFRVSLYMSNRSLNKQSLGFQALQKEVKSQIIEKTDASNLEDLRRPSVSLKWTASYSHGKRGIDGNEDESRTKSSDMSDCNCALS